MRDSSIELNGPWTSYTGRGNLQPKHTRAAKGARAVKGLAQRQTLAERSRAHPARRPGEPTRAGGQPPPARLFSDASVARSCWHRKGWGHSAQAVAHSARWHAMGSCSCAYCGIVYWCNFTKVLVTCWVVACNAPCSPGSCAGGAAFSSMSPTPRLAAFYSCPAPSSHSIFLKRCQF